MLRDITNTRYEKYRVTIGAGKALSVDKAFGIISGDTFFKANSSQRKPVMTKYLIIIICISSSLSHTSEIKIPNEVFFRFEIQQLRNEGNIGIIDFAECINIFSIANQTVNSLKLFNEVCSLTQSYKRKFCNGKYHAKKRADSNKKLVFNVLFFNNPDTLKSLMREYNTGKSLGNELFQ